MAKTFEGKLNHSANMWFHKMELKIGNLCSLRESFPDENVLGKVS